MKEELVSKFTYECECGCGELHFSQWKDDGLSFIGYYTPAFHQIRFLDRITSKAKIIWNVLIGREYCLYEIVIEDNYKLAEFKEFVLKMRELGNE